MISAKNYSFVELFAGAGGFSLGLEQAGFSRIAAVEVDKWACDTLRENNKTGTVFEKDIRLFSNDEISKIESPDVLIGGPPCQGFSVAGPAQYGIEDPRNNLFIHYLRFVDILRPKICVIENVPALFTKTISKGVTASTIIIELFAEIGYRCQQYLLDSADYGVPQSRKRAFIVALADGFEFCPPERTHSLPNAQLNLFNKTLQFITVWDAISDLPIIDSSEGSDEKVPYPSDAKSAYQVIMRDGSDGVYNHIAMRHTKRLIERFKTIPQGKSLKDVPLEHGQLEKITGNISNTPYKSNNQRLDPNKVSLAIPASFQSNFLHPFANRNLTAREAARLMSFPDRYIFRGQRTAMSWEPYLSQYNQIGNAVCPLVAKAIGSSLIASLKKSKNYTVKSTISLNLQEWLNLAKPDEILELNSPIKRNIILKNELSVLGMKMIKDVTSYKVVDGYITYREGINIPVYYLPIAVLLSTEKKCIICNNKLAPYGCHSDFMPFLISKESVDSLIIKKKDHGLDYHLRILDNRNYQCAHFVAEILEEIGLVNIINGDNPRTGRKVRGLVVSKLTDEINNYRSIVNKLIYDN